MVSVFVCDDDSCNFNWSACLLEHNHSLSVSHHWHTAWWENLPHKRAWHRHLHLTISLSAWVTIHLSFQISYNEKGGGKSSILRHILSCMSYGIWQLYKRKLHLLSCLLSCNCFVCVHSIWEVSLLKTLLNYTICQLIDQMNCKSSLRSVYSIFLVVGLCAHAWNGGCVTFRCS